MSYLGGFMGGSPDYNGNPGILGLYQFVQSGYDAGKAKAQNQALAQLSQKAYMDTGDAQKQDIAQAIGIDPQTGYALAGKAQAQQAAQQAQQQKMLERYGKAASAILQAKQSGDDAAAEGIYQAMMPELQMHAAQTGQPPPPPTLDASVMPTVYKLASMYASIPQPDKGVVVSQGGAVVDPMTGRQMYRNPAAPKITPQGYQAVLGPDGTYHAAQIPIQGAQNGMGMGAAVPGAGAGVPQAPTQPEAGGVQFQFAPDTPQAVIDAAKAAAAASGDLPAQGGQQSTQGAPQTLAQAVGGNKHVSTLSAQEVAALGLPAGTIAQRSPDGTLHVVSKPGAGGIFGDDGQNSFTPEAQQLLATATEQGLKIPIPSVGMGGAARVQFVNGLAKDINEKHIPYDLALQEMRFGLDADPGIKKSQQLYSTTKTLEAGADGLAQQALQLSGTVSRGQIPLFNAWVNAGRRATSDPDVARFDRAINAFTKDYAKVVSGALGSSAATEGEIKSATAQLMASNSPEVFAANVDQMQKEMHIRTGAMLDSIRQQVAAVANGGLPSGTAPAFGNPTPPRGQQAAPAASAPSGWSIEEVH